MIKVPVGSSTALGPLKIEAFYDGAGKYGSDDVVCTVPVV